MADLRLVARDEVFSAGAAAGIGLDASSLRRLVRAGECYRLTRGWYAVRPPRDARDRHRLATIALVRSFAGRVCPSHHSLLVLAALPTFRADLAVVHLTRMSDQWSRQRPGAAIHCALGGRVSLAAAVVQTGQVSGAMDALVAADAALHLGKVSVAELRAALTAFRRHPGIAEVRRVLEHVDGRTESPGETRLRYTMTALGFRVTPQVVIRDGYREYRVDFLVDGTRVVVEFDGLVKYSVAASLVEEKRREDRLRSLGYEVVRFVWSDLDRPEKIRAELLQAVARSRRAA